MKREAAELFVEGLRQAGVDANVDEVRQRMTYLNDVGSAANEVQRWHVEADHCYAGAHRCALCIASGKWAKR